ncbi:MAG: hypothetical protein RR784_06475 [Burkholderiaceae bacterium]
MEPWIFRYVLRYDNGTGPNTDGGWCSLAISKPVIRRTARIGDWLVALRSKRANEVIYAMRVEERIGFSDFWSDPRFRCKRPDRSPLADNIYRPLEGGGFEQIPNAAHDASDIARDLGGRWVLLSQTFWYFGDHSPTLPADLLHLVHSNQGHGLHVNRRPDDAMRLEPWLRTWPIGVHGHPVGPRKPRKTRPPAAA